ncbi:MAG: hypothetical protein KF789_12545 [Bdellovibrionaceae bacterium]|nr:hypothetical protein [Pseudobdellovibrionaceae bacterium]
MLSLRFSAFLLVFSALSLAQASICQEVQRRIGDGRAFQNFIQNASQPDMVRIDKTEASNELLVRSDKAPSHIRLKDYGLLCTFKALEPNAYFPQEQIFGFAVPNAKGECWIYAARISRLVPPEEDARFIREGFCVYPVSANPETSWYGTSAFLPESGE